MTSKNLIFKNILIYGILVSLIFWSNPVYGNILRFIYLLTFINFFFDYKYFRLLYLNYKKILYLFIFIFFHYLSIKFYDVEIDVFKFSLNSSLILVNFIYLICFWEIVRNNFEKILKLYVNVLTLTILFFLLLSLDFNNIIESCNPAEANLLLRSYLGEFSHVALLGLPISLFSFFYLKYNPALILIILLVTYLNSFTLMSSFIFFAVLHFVLNITKKRFLLEKRNFFIFIIIAFIFNAFFSENCFQRLTHINKIFIENKSSLSNFLPLIPNENFVDQNIKTTELSINENNLSINKNNQDKKIILHNKNLSLQVILYNLLVMKNSLQDYPFGIGLGNYSHAFYVYKDLIGRDFSFERRVYVLNDSDASSLFIKIMTELGLFNLFILYFFLIFFFKSKINKKYLILLILLLFTQSLRGVGYFSAGGTFLILSLFYFHKNKIIK